MKHLHEEGAKLIVTDVYEESILRVKEEFPDVEVVTPEEIFSVAGFREHLKMQVQSMILQIFAISKRDNLPTYKAADIMIENKIETIGRIQRKYTGNK